MHGQWEEQEYNVCSTSKSVEASKFKQRLKSTNRKCQMTARQPGTYSNCENAIVAEGGEDNDQGQPMGQRVTTHIGDYLQGDGKQ